MRFAMNFLVYVLLGVASFSLEGMSKVTRLCRSNSTASAHRQEKQLVLTEGNIIILMTCIKPEWLASHKEEINTHGCSTAEFGLSLTTIEQLETCKPYYELWQGKCKLLANLANRDKQLV